MRFSMAKAATDGTVTRHVRTIAEPATASSRNEPASSPAASNAIETANSANEVFAMLVIRIFLLFAKVLKPAIAGTVK